MIVREVKLANFRCHGAYKLECQDKITKILGENGCGKTSVLEAIYIALRGKSFRAVDSEILRRGSEMYSVEVGLNNGEKVVVVYDGVSKKFAVGGKRYGRLPKDYRYPVVLFEPSDLNLVGASPTRKRAYFDRLFGDLDARYSNSLAKYNKALKQRNELLKNDVVRVEDLFSWNVMLAKYGAELVEWRREYVKRINRRITEVYRRIAKNQDETELEYVSEVDKGDYLKELEMRFGKDRALGYTSFGPHRDDYEFKFNKVAADGSASRGELRSLILALKFIEAEMLTELDGRKPLILLDDVFSELDEMRQKCLVTNFRDNQVIITSVS